MPEANPKPKEMSDTVYRLLTAASLLGAQTLDKEQWLIEDIAFILKDYGIKDVEELEEVVKKAGRTKKEK